MRINDNDNFMHFLRLGQRGTMVLFVTYIQCGVLLLLLGDIMEASQLLDYYPCLLWLLELGYPAFVVANELSDT